MTAAELFALPDDDRTDRRLIRGRLVERPYPLRCPAHGATAANLCVVVGGRTEDETGGRWKGYGYGCPYRLSSDPDTVICFDASVVPAAVADGTPKRALYIDGLPTLAVEEIDLSDPADAVAELIGVAVTAGIPMVWVVDPFEEIVTVYRPGDGRIVYNCDQEIDASAVIPGFRCRVAKIFE